MYQILLPRNFLSRHKWLIIYSRNTNFLEIHPQFPPIRLEGVVELDNVSPHHTRQAPLVHTPCLVTEIISCVIDLMYRHDHCRDHGRVLLWHVQSQAESIKLARNSQLHAQNRVAAEMAITTPFLRN